MVQPEPTKAILQLAKVATIYMACLEYACPYPPPFLLAQNLPLKQILLTDNTHMTLKALSVIKWLIIIGTKALVTSSLAPRLENMEQG